MLQNIKHMIRISMIWYVDTIIHFLYSPYDNLLLLLLLFYY